MRKTLFQTFATPLVLLVVTVVGLIIGVVADGVWDGVAVVALAAPLLAISVSLFLRPSRSLQRNLEAEPTGVDTQSTN